MYFSILSKKQFCGIALFFVLLSVASPSLFAAVTFTQNGLLYTVTKETATERTVSVKAADGFSNTVVTIPDSVENNGTKYAVTTIPTDGFKAKTTLTTLVFAPNSKLTTIGANAFLKCSNLGGNLTIPASVTSIGANAFQQTAITSLNFEEGSRLTSLPNYAFYLCQNLGGTITIPVSIQKIGTCCFCQTAIDGVVFPENSGLTTIGQESFRDCPNFQANDTLVLPSTVTDIYYGAFYNSPKIKAIKITSQNAPKLGHSNVFYNTTCPFIVPTGTYLDYTSAKGWTFAYQMRITDGTPLTIERNNVLYRPTTDTTAFVIGCTDGYTGVVTIKDTIQQWGKTFVTTEIVAKAFQNTAISGLDIKNSNLQYIRQYAFDGCRQLDGTIEFPNSLKMIEQYAFQNNIKLKGVKFEEGLETIGSRAFSLCGSISGIIEFPTTLLTINSYAFTENRSITGVVFKEGLKTISSYAFYSCTNIAGTIAFPSTLESLGGSAFAYNYMLQRVVFTPNEQEGILTINGSAFYECNKLSGDLIIPKSVKRILGSAFYNCGVFSSIQLPQSGLDSISDYAFGRKVLSTQSTAVVRIPASVTGIGQNAFLNQVLDSLVIAQRPTPPNMHALGGMFDGADYPIYIPHGTYYTYCSAPGWSPYIFAKSKSTIF